MEEVKIERSEGELAVFVSCILHPTSLQSALQSLGNDQERKLLACVGGDPKWVNEPAFSLRAFVSNAVSIFRWSIYKSNFFSLEKDRRHLGPLILVIKTIRFLRIHSFMSYLIVNRVHCTFYL